jgi:DNA polymerase I-like protein with 3'-5' exonuclease and polymerase domains
LYQYIKEQSELDSVLGWLNDRRFIVLDSETAGIDPFRSKLITLQLGDKEHQFVIDCRKVNVAPLKSAIEDPNLIKLGQNIKFDWQMLYKILGWQMQNVQDTMIAEQVLRCGLHAGAGLDDLMLRYFNTSIDKTIRASFHNIGNNELTEDQIKYAASDCIWPHMIITPQWEEIRKRGLKATLQLEFEFIPVIAHMELQGMAMDVDAWKLLYQNSLKQRNKAEVDLDNFFGIVPIRQEGLFGDGDIFKPIQYTSWQQILKALNKRGYEGVANTLASTLALAAINGELPVEFVEALLRYRTHTKKISTYGLNFLNAIDPITNRIHTVFGQTWTASGRLNSGQKAGEIGEEGEIEVPYKVNFQNIPREQEFRNCFIPAPGYAFLIYDYQAIEPRILGEMSKDPTYLYAFNNDKDIYGEVGTKIYGQYVGKKTSEGKILRDKTKVVVLGNAYGTGKEKFHRKLLVDMNVKPDNTLVNPILKISREESDNLWQKFFNICPGIKKTLDQLSALADPILSQRRFYEVTTANESYDEVYKKCFESLIEYRPEEQADAIARRVANNRAYITYSEAIGGRKLFFKPYHRSSWTEARDHPMQGCTATILKTAMVLVNKAIKEHGHDARFVNQVHDEVILECKASEAPEIALYVKPLLEAAGQKFLKVVPCRVEGGIKTRWEKE